MSFLYKNCKRSSVLIFFLLFAFCLFFFLKNNPLKAIYKNKVLYDISTEELNKFAINNSKIKNLKDVFKENTDNAFLFNVDALCDSQGLEIGVNLISKNQNDDSFFVKLYDKDYKEIKFNDNANFNKAILTKGNNHLLFVFENIESSIENLNKNLKDIKIVVYLNNNIELQKILITKLKSNYRGLGIICYIVLSLLYSFLLISIFFILKCNKNNILNFNNIIKFLAGSFGIIFLVLFAYKFNWNFFKVPLSFGGGDDLHFLSVAKNAIDGNGFWFMQDLQAPFGTKRYDFPMLMAFYYGFFRFFGFFTSNVILVNNLYYLCTFIFAFWAFYFVSRRLSILPSLCVLGGILFTFSQYHFSRSLIHITASSYFVAPLVIYLCYLIGVNDDFNKIYSDKKEKVFLYSLILFFCFLIGSTDIFYAYFGCGFLVISILYALFNKRYLASKRGVAILVLLITFILSNIYPVILNNLIAGTVRASSRRPFEAFYYGLMFVHLFMPLHHNGHIFSSLVTRYRNDSFFKGEMLTSYLGIIALIGFLSLLAFLIFDGLNKKFEDKEENKNKGFIRFLASLNFFGFFLGCSAGLSTFISLCGFTKVRTYNRISVYILLFSVIFLIYFLNLLFEKRIINLKKLSYKFIYLIFLFSLVLFHFYDTRLYKFKKKSDFINAKEKVINIKKYATRINDLYAKHTNILQLPIIPYPESKVPSWGANCNVQAMPYLFSKNLSWSFGSLPHTETLFWFRQLFANVSADKLIYNAKKYGFNGISIHTNLFPKGKKLVNNLLKLGYKPNFTDDKKEIYFYDLSKVNIDSENSNDDLVNMIDFNKYLYKGFLINENTKFLKSKWAVGNKLKNGSKVITTLKFFSPIDRAYKIKLEFFSPIKNKLEVYIDKFNVENFDINVGNNEIVVEPIMVKNFGDKNPFVTMNLIFKNGITKRDLFKVNKDKKIVGAKFTKIYLAY